MNPVPALAAAIRDVPDFPKPGILFKDITPLLADGALFRQTVDLFAERHLSAPPDKVAVIEARGFLFGSALAYRLGVGVIPVRKQGKLPYETLAVSYDLEYGSATLEMHVDAVRADERILLFDDLLATGGTAAATVEMIQRMGGIVTEIDFLIELAFLKGRDKLAGHTVFAPIVC